MSTGTESSAAYGLEPEADDAGAEAAKPCILVVEDSRPALQELSRPLSADYMPITAKDGAEAWELLLSRPEIELVITDIVMPRLSGHDLLLKIRASENPQIRNLPVIVIAGVVDRDDRHLAFRNGANDFITKPIDAAELLARVRVHHKLARTIHELELSRRALAEQAITDPLTHLKNRRAFFQEGKDRLALSQRANTPLSVMLLDLDDFKGVNDTYGHRAGDQVLLAVAELLARLSRSVDTVARVGGEEFAIILPGTNRQGAVVLAERIRGALEQAAFAVGSARVPLTVSIGIAASDADPADSIDTLLHAADRRMYVAKQSGRNRVYASDPTAR